MRNQNVVFQVLLTNHQQPITHHNKNILHNTHITPLHPPSTHTPPKISTITPPKKPTPTKTHTLADTNNSVPHHLTSHRRRLSVYPKLTPQCVCATTPTCVNPINLTYFKHPTLLSSHIP